MSHERPDPGARDSRVPRQTGIRPNRLYPRLLVICLLLFCGVMVLAAPASAQRRSTSNDIQKAQQHVDRGDGFFDQKRYDQAIAEYTAALVLAPHPDLVWNIARAHEEMDRLGQAIALFNRYKTMFVGEGDRAEAEAKIAELRQRLLAKRTGTLVVETPSERARVFVGGAPVGTGREVIVDVKPGRYRVRVELDDHDPFEQVVAVDPADRAVVKAMPRLIRKLSVLIVACEVPGARVSVDGGAPVPPGTALQVREGAHRIRVSADKRDPVEREVTVGANVTHTETVELGPLRHPDRFESWTGQYVALGPADGDGASRFERSTLTLDGEKMTGTLVVPESRTLEPWRRSHCGGAETLNWSTTYRARVKVDRGSAVIELDNGTLNDCSCQTWCQVVPTDRLELVPLPGREGFVGGLVLLRSGLDDGARHAWVRAPHPTQLADRWEVVTWRGDFRTDDRLQVGPATSLARKMSGAVPSWKRSACGADTFELRASYPTQLVVDGERVVLDFEGPRDERCSCDGACGAAPLMADEPLRLLVFTRYLVGAGTLLRRAPAPAGLPARGQPPGAQGRASQGQRP